MHRFLSLARSSGGSSAIEIIEKDDDMIKVVEMTMDEDAAMNDKIVNIE